MVCDAVDAELKYRILMNRKNKEMIGLRDSLAEMEFARAL
jgi:hypothetical protein